MLDSSIFRRSSFFLSLTILTGMTGLCFQVIWQRYLIILLGSDAKATSIVVSFFLLGLALGYRFFGQRTEKIDDRYKLLKLYGFLEMAIGAYAIIFKNYFELIQIFLSKLPNSYLIDLMLSGLLIVPVTFLMGATVPMLTKALPSRIDEINRIHAQIYGWNTFGAFIGCFVSVIFFIPAFGLHLSLILCGVINIVVGFLFGINSFPGSIQQMARGESDQQTSLQKSDCILIAFVSGVCSLCLEILLVRLMNLSAGSSHAIFPVVVGVFIAGLSFGSLKIPAKISPSYLLRQVLVGVVSLAVVYLSVPYWPYWVAVIRTNLTTMPSHFPLFWVLVCGFVGLVSFSWLIPLARLLPVTYALIPKNAKNYGDLCGKVYFMNTVGAFAGAVLLGNWALQFVSLEILFKVVILLLTTIVMFLVFRLRRSVTRLNAILATVFIPLAVVGFGHWDRSLHGISLFRIVDPAILSHVRGFFPDLNALTQTRSLFLKDDPVTTAYVGEKEYPSGKKGKMIATNGKSDSNTYSDYSTVTLMGLIPYLYAPSETDMNALVIGLGTGITSGYLARAQDIRRVSTLEISPAIIEAQTNFSAENFGVVENPKSKIIETDAFRFLSRSREKFQIISAEPSNPWIVGVENLFSHEFYHLISEHLTDDGVFLQWIQGYETDAKIVLGILNSLSKSFRSLMLFRVGPSDFAVLASHRRLEFSQKSAERFNESPSLLVRKNLGLKTLDHISSLQKFSSAQLRAIVKILPQQEHSLYYPWLGQYAMKAFFMKSTFTGLDLPDYLKLRFFDLNASRYEAYERLFSDPEGLNNDCSIDPTKAFICDQLIDGSMDFQQLLGLSRRKIAWKSVPSLLSLYRRLRLAGFQSPLPQLLLEISSLIKSKLQSVGGQRYVSDPDLLLWSRDLADLLWLEQMEDEAKVLQSLISSIELVPNYKLVEYRRLSAMFKDLPIELD